MFRLEAKLKVYVHREAVDFRKSINGLSALVEESGLDPFAPALYAFSNRRRDRIMILGWGGNGFWLLMKRFA
jgi:transposase